MGVSRREEEWVKKDAAVMVFDWRLYAAEPILSATGMDIKKGDIIEVIVPPFEYRNQIISFGLPNACALYLGYAFRLSKEAIKILSKISKRIKNKRVPDKLAFTYFERIMGAVFFAYSSIEAFANMQIPDDHYHYKKRKKIFLAEAKNTIERWESTEVKIGEILPESLKIESPID